MGKSVAELGATRFVGIDWAAEEHSVSVLDESGRGVMAFTIAHSREGLETLVNRLAKLGASGTVDAPPTKSAAGRRSPSKRPAHR